MSTVQQLQRGFANLLTPNEADKKPVILVLGCTGRTGNLVAQELEKHGDVVVRRTARKPDQLNAWKAEGTDAVFLNMDDPKTFAMAMHGVDRLYLMTEATVGMSTHGKTLIDAAVKAGVQHVVKLSCYYQWDCIVPQWAWL
ncbi:hypothetical protein RvY_08130 [Ramazzottius varieornatus]|uniref:NAD(P)-binding domain-containing protein n=1 Tax=Ramazzottius varieornatus TaxID=947166 RepID=A0A1D1V4P0_RAMVA|nr:hypothetical protein RvY_08130 [Ramazzottius varieornatus]